MGNNGKIWTTMTTAKMEQLYNEGLNLKEVGKLAGIGPVGVWKRFKKEGITLRKHGMEKGTVWAVKKRGKEFLGQDGRWWVRNVRPEQKKASVHRSVVVFEEAFGPVPKGYVVHHKDFNKENDSLDNLELMTSAQHGILHNKGKRVNIINLYEVDLDLLKSLRLEYEYSQEQVASKIGVIQNAVSKWEVGRNLPGKKYIKRLSKLYDVPVSLLMKPTRIITINMLIYR